MVWLDVLLWRYSRSVHEWHEKEMDSQELEG
jgi:polyferredoxin